MRRSCERKLVRESGGLGTLGEGEEAGGAAVRSGGSSAARLVLGLGGDRSFGLDFGSGSNGVTFRGSTGVGVFFDAHQILIRDFPAEVLVLSALLEMLFEEDGTARVGDERAGSGQEDIAGTILHRNWTPETGAV